jgi:hypothetical protein
MVTTLQENEKDNGTWWDIPCSLLHSLSPDSCLMLMEYSWLDIWAQNSGNKNGFFRTRNQIEKRLWLSKGVQQRKERELIAKELIQIEFDKQKMRLCIHVDRGKVKKIKEQSLCGFYRIHRNLLRFGLNMDTAIYFMELKYWWEVHGEIPFYKSIAVITNRTGYSEKKQRLCMAFLKQDGFVSTERKKAVSGEGTVRMFISLNMELFNSVIDEKNFTE